MIIYTNEFGDDQDELDDDERESLDDFAGDLKKAFPEMVEPEEGIQEEEEEGYIEPEESDLGSEYPSMKEEEEEPSKVLIDWEDLTLDDPVPPALDEYKGREIYTRLRVEDFEREAAADGVGEMLTSIMKEALIRHLGKAIDLKELAHHAEDYRLIKNYIKKNMPGELLDKLYPEMRKPKSVELREVLRNY